MKKVGVFLIFSLVICLALVASPVVAVPPLGSTNYVTFSGNNIGGSLLYLDGTFYDVISGTSIDIPNGNTYNWSSISKDGYYPATGIIDFYPGDRLTLISPSRSPQNR